MYRLAFALPMPSAESHTMKLKRLFDKYFQPAMPGEKDTFRGVDFKFSPTRLYEGKELEVAFRALRGKMEQDLAAKESKAKASAKKPEEKKDEIERYYADFEADVKSLNTHIAGFIDETGQRVEKFRQDYMFEIVDKIFSQPELIKDAQDNDKVNLIHTYLQKKEGLDKKILDKASDLIKDLSEKYPVISKMSKTVVDENESFISGKDLKWLTDSSMETWQSHVKTPVSAPDKKAPSVTPVKEVKFKLLEHELNMMQDDVGSLEDKLEEAVVRKPMPVTMESKKMAYARVYQGSGGGGSFSIGDVFQSWDEFRKKEDEENQKQEAKVKVIHDQIAAWKKRRKLVVDKSVEEIKAIAGSTKNEALKAELDKFLQDFIDDAASVIQKSQAHPKRTAPTTIYQVNLVDGLTELLEEFNDFYGLYHGAIWFRDKVEEVPLEERHVDKLIKKEAATEMEFKSLTGQAEEVERLKKSALKPLQMFTHANLRDENIRKLSRIAMKALGVYKSKCWDYIKARDVYEASMSQKVAEQRAAADQPFERVFPYTELEQKLKDKIDNPEIQGYALGELRILERGLKEKYNNPTAREELHAKKRGISARQFLAPYMKAATKLFMAKWITMAPKYEVEESHSGKYEAVTKLLENFQKGGFIPEFKKRKHTLIKPGKPTSSDILEHIENVWLNRPEPLTEEDLPEEESKAEKKLQQDWENDIEKMIRDMTVFPPGGSSAEGGKNRPKVPKEPPVEITREHMMQEIKKYLEGSEKPAEFLKKLIHHFMKNIRHGVEEEESIPFQDDVVSGIVGMLMQIPTTVRSIGVSVPEKVFRREKMQKTEPGLGFKKDQAPRLAVRWLEKTLTSDIVIDSKEEAIEMLDKIKALYELMEKLLAPAKIYKNDVKGLWKENLPKGFLEACERLGVHVKETTVPKGTDPETVQYLKEHEERFKKSDVEALPQLAYKLASSFIGVPIKEGYDALVS